MSWFLSKCEAGDHCSCCKCSPAVASGGEGSQSDERRAILSYCQLALSQLNGLVCDVPQLYPKGWCMALYAMHIWLSTGIFFSVSVVATYNKFWVKLPGPIISQHGVTPLPTQSDTTPPPAHSTTPSILPGPVSIWMSSDVFPWGSTSWTKDYGIGTLPEHTVINKLCMSNAHNILRPITSYYITPSVYLRGMWPIKILHPRSSWLWSKRRSALLLPLHDDRRSRQNGLTLNISFKLRQCVSPGCINQISAKPEPFYEFHTVLALSSAFLCQALQLSTSHE